MSCADVIENGQAGKQNEKSVVVKMESKERTNLFLGLHKELEEKPEKKRVTGSR